jgi:hypothetical protein
VGVIGSNPTNRSIPTPARIQLQPAAIEGLRFIRLGPNRSSIPPRHAAGSLIKPWAVRKRFAYRDPGGEKLTILQPRIPQLLILIQILNPVAT